MDVSLAHARSLASAATEQNKRAEQELRAEAEEARQMALALHSAAVAAIDASAGGESSASVFWQGEEEAPMLALCTEAGVAPDNIQRPIPIRQQRGSERVSTQAFADRCRRLGIDISCGESSASKARRLQAARERSEAILDRELGPNWRLFGRG